VSYISSAGMAGVAPGYGKTCRQDVLHGEVLEDDHVIAADQAGAGLVEEVGADAAERAAVQHAGLHLVRVRPAFVSRPHEHRAYTCNPNI
jgi:hypothetical protein